MWSRTIMCQLLKQHKLSLISAWRLHAKAHEITSCNICKKVSVEQLRVDTIFYFFILLIKKKKTFELPLTVGEEDWHD